jgi:lipoprotein-anchoring transpeptidase ErfK/SrfK
VKIAWALGIVLAGTAFTCSSALAAPVPAIHLTASHAVAVGERAEFRGKLVPPRPYATVRLFKGSSLLGKAPVKKDGSFYVTAPLASPGPYLARFRGAASNPVRVLIRPVLSAHLVGAQTVGSQLAAVARVRPASAGPIRVRVLRNGKETFDRRFAGGAARVALGTVAPGTVRVEVSTEPGDGFAVRSTAVQAKLEFPFLQPGSSGSLVVALEQRLRELGYATPSLSSTFSYSLRDSVFAFQKLNGISRDGVVGPATRQKLLDPVPARPRYSEPASHIEVDKTRQVLLDVREGKIAQILPVSTAGIAGYSTPVGRFAVYRKVTGWDHSPLGVLYDPLYFPGGYAIHGSPSVPPYPASHGCVRIPMWASAAFYEQHGYGETVYVY